MNAFLQRFKTLGRRNPVAMFSLALLLVLGVTDYFLWQRGAKLAAQSERVRQDGETMLLSLSGQGRIQSQYASTKEALAAIEQNLASEADLAGNLDYFYQFEKTAKIRLSGISQLSSSGGGAESHYRSIPFSLRLLGPYSQLLTYLHELETGPRLLRIKSYRFSQSDASADLISLDLTVEILGRP